MIDDAFLGAGRLRRPISIQAQQTAQDAMGQPLQTWATVREARGGRDLVSMREMFGGEQLNAQNMCAWTVRYCATSPLLPGMRIVDGGTVFMVHAVNNVRHENFMVHALCLTLNAGSTN